MNFFPTRQIALSLGSVSVHWYGIMYALGFIFGILLLPYLSRISGLELSSKKRDDLVLFIFAGVILGGRLGYVLFYGVSYYLSHPLEIFAIWQGGMSSHGGFIGVALGLLYFAWRQKIDVFRITDTVVVPVALGLLLGRLGNLINGELYGTVTTLPWGMHFPNVDGLRHPTQIYAMLKDASIALLCFWTLKYSYASIFKTGRTTAVFLMSYAVLRFIIEIFRDQAPYGFTEIIGLSLSRGQLLTVPFFLAGASILLLRKAKK